MITTKDLMTVHPVTTRQETDLAQAAQIIINKGISSVPVTDFDSRMVGLLTKRDVVKALGQVNKNVVLEA